MHGCQMRLVFFYFFLASLGFSQQQTHKWYFSKYAALDFSLANPISINNSSMFATEGCASMADQSGNLLFYTNGVDVWNKNHSIMNNGNFLFGNTSSTQSAFAVKKPGSGNLYYVFTTGAGGTGMLCYSVIDMSLAAGLGSVTVKNFTMAVNMTEKLCGVQHCNGNDVWVVAHKYNSNDFYSYLLTSAGVNTVPVISSVGAIHAIPTGTNNGTYSGTMKISPSGLKLGLVIYDPQNQAELFDFNSSTGMVSNPIDLGATFSMYGCEFSPDGSKFYVTEENQYSKIHQWNLCLPTTTAIIASHTVVATSTIQNSSFLALQLASNGKMYVAQISQNAISAIDKPNVIGTGCNFVPAAVALGTGTCTQGLPNHMSTYFRDKGTFDTLHLTCGSVSFTARPPDYCAGLNYSVSSVLWNFNDPLAAGSNSSTLVSPVHTYSQNGTYTVKLVLYRNCSVDTVSQVIQVTDFPTLNVSGKTIFCKGEKTTLSFSGANTYSLNNQSVSQNTAVLQPTANAVYTLSGSNNQNGCISTRVFSITVQACLGVNPNSEINDALSIFPNPFQEQIQVKSSLTGELLLYNSLAICVKRLLINEDSTSIDTRYLPTGVYTVVFNTSEGKVIYKLCKSDEL